MHQVFKFFVIEPHRTYSKFSTQTALVFIQECVDNYIQDLPSKMLQITMILQLACIMTSKSFRLWTWE